MFWTFPYDDTHEVAQLQKELEFFFDKLRQTSPGMPFSTSLLFSLAFSEKLKQGKKQKLIQLFESFFLEFSKLHDSSKTELIDCFFATNKVDELLNDISVGIDVELLKLKQFPLALITSVKDLFIYMYETTMKPARNRHYKALIAGISSYCPFCGIERLISDRNKTQDYDHILNKGTYPFAAVNLRNLVPMGSVCNQKYKRGIDILTDLNGQRRKYANPYTQAIPVKVEFQGSILPSVSNRRGTWSITFLVNPGDEPYVQTWAEVFDIKNRYEEFIVKDHYETWRRQFINRKKGAIHNVHELKSNFSREANQYANHLYIDKDFLRYALFSFWADCDDMVFYNTVLRELRA